MNHQVDMKRLRKEYEGGDKPALAMAIVLCGRRHKALPDWAAAAWQAGWVSVVARRLASWNDVLGEVKLKTPKQIAREHRQLDQLYRLGQLLLPAMRWPIERDSEGAFRWLADQMGGGIKPRAVRELYYKTVRSAVDGSGLRLIEPFLPPRRRP